MSFRRKSAVLAVSAAVLAAVALTPATSFAAGPPAAATAYQSAVITHEGGSVSGFGITATFAPGAVATDRLIVLGNWPNGQDVTPPAGTTAVKTFGIQECNVDYTGCTSVFGNYPNSSLAGTEKIKGQVVSYSAFQPLGTVANADGNTTFGTKDNKLVTITTNTTADTVYVYNANNSTTATAYRLLPSTSDGSTLTFKTFQPIVWTLTALTS